MRKHAAIKACSGTAIWWLSQCNHRVTMLILVAMSVLALPVHASDWIAFDAEGHADAAVQVDIVHSSLDSLVLHVSCAGMVLEEDIAGGNLCTRLNIAGETMFEKPGWPMIPIVRRAIATPEYGGE